MNDLAQICSVQFAPVQIGKQIESEENKCANNNMFAPKNPIKLIRGPSVPVFGYSTSFSCYVNKALKMWLVTRPVGSSNKKEGIVGLPDSALRFTF